MTIPLRGKDYPPDLALTVRCLSCGLNQFANRSKCRRCRKRFLPVMPIPAVQLPAVALAPVKASMTYPIAIGLTVKLLRLAQGLSQRNAAALYVPAKPHNGLAGSRGVPTYRNGTQVRAAQRARTFFSKIENFRYTHALDLATISRVAAALGTTTYQIIRMVEILMSSDIPGGSSCS